MRTFYFGRNKTKPILQATVLKLTDHLLVSMNTTNVKRNNEGKRRKRKNEGLNRRKDTLIKKAYELGEFDGIDVALIIFKHSRYTTYRSRDYASWPPSMAEIVSKALASLKYTTSADTDLANCLSSPEEYVTGRHREAPFQKSKEIFWLGRIRRKERISRG